MKRPFSFEQAEVGEELRALSYEVTAGKLDAFRSATTNPRASMITIAAKEYAYLLWAVYEEVMSINAKHEAWYSKVPTVGDVITARRAGSRTSTSAGAGATWWWRPGRPTRPATRSVVTG